MTWLTAAEALAVTGTRKQTLYANVSRGRIRARPDPEDSRKSLYAEEDVWRLAARRRGRPSRENVAGEAISWGEPVLGSALSTVVAGRLYYRGCDVAELVETASVEEVAGLLWQIDAVELTGSVASDGQGLAALWNWLAQRAATDGPSLGRNSAMLRRLAAALYGGIAGVLAGPGPAPVHERLAARWKRPAAADLLRKTLVLLADHDLNASTFATRVTVSTGASFAASVLAGLAALSGPRHGGAPKAVAALIGAARQDGAQQAISDWLARGEPLPAFGHRLYPEGDIRAKALLQAMPLSDEFKSLREAATRMTGEMPNVDFAMAAIKEIHHLPDDAPLTIFALGRAIGWLAHALEQAESGELIRPRARYTGPPVGG